MQPLSQVSDALVHHCHLGVPLVQKLLVLGQLTALLQVMTVTSLRHTALLFNQKSFIACPGKQIRNPKKLDATGLLEDQLLLIQPSRMTMI